jgi:hypothetical protein
MEIINNLDSPKESMLNFSDYQKDIAQIDENKEI